MTEQNKKGLEKALNDYIELKRNQAECTGFIDGFEKAIEYMNQGLLLPKHDVSKRFELKAKIKIIENTSSHGFEIDEIVTVIDFEAKYNQWVCEGNSGKRWYVNEDEGTVC